VTLLLSSFGCLAGLTERQRRAIEALLLAPNVTAAAGRARVGERTLWRKFELDSSGLEWNI
jgi:hypothetical protein